MLPQNVGYSPYLKKMTDVAVGVGKALGPRKKLPKAVDVSQYKGVADSVQKYTPQAYTGDKKTIPVSRKSIGRLSVPYEGSTRYEKVHPGIDLAAPSGTLIPSTTGGKVSEIISGKRQGDQAFGNYIIVTDNEGNKHRYSHLSASYVKVGQPVHRGMPIAAMGKSGQVYSPSGGDPSHLDYRIRDLYGKYVDPRLFIQ
jgi:murein DD-endopeptidase MepM/ murein hydrolase activator NlpD